MRLDGAGDIFKQQVANVLEERVHRIKSFVDQDTAVSRDELARFVWGTARKVFEIIQPNMKDGPDSKRMRAWADCKGMLKALINWEKFSHGQYVADCVNNVIEKKVVEVLDNYRTFVLTGEIKTKHPPPKLLGETDEILVVDKPCKYTCSFGDRSGKIPDLGLGHMGEKASASLLLNGESDKIQLHEYLALKYNYENAIGTREFWKTVRAKNLDKCPCTCGSCVNCAATQSGCCNRLDVETSGVMICAKTPLGFGEIRQQFSSDHSLEEGGTEKYYMCLVHGEVKLPKKDDVRNEHWSHTLKDGRGRIEVSVAFDKSIWKALPYDDGTTQNHKEQKTDTRLDAQRALTFYEPVAWFEYSNGEIFTLCHLQIITGRTHQIRFHMQQIGHSLVGDMNYHAPPADRGWCPRVFLHSYQTKFREPFTARWFEATSPLPQDLGEILEKVLGKPVRVAEGKKFQSRRQHPELQEFLTQYNPSVPLLFTHDAPANKDVIMAKIAAAKEGGAVNGRKKQDQAWGNNGWGGNNGQSWEGGGWGNSSGSDWKSGDWGKKDEKWEASSSSAPAKPKAAGGDDDEDDWGGWTGDKKEAAAAAEPDAKRQRVDAPAAAPAAPQQTPQRPEPPRGLGSFRPPGTPGAAGGAAPPPAQAPAAAPQPAPVQTPAAGVGASGWKKMQSRSTPGAFYYWNPATGQTLTEPPEPWQKKESRSTPGVFYYFNTLTGQSVFEKPDV